MDQRPTTDTPKRHRAHAGAAPTHPDPLVRQLLALVPDTQRQALRLRPPDGWYLRQMRAQLERIHTRLSQRAESDLTVHWHGWAMVAASAIGRIAKRQRERG